MNKAALSGLLLAFGFSLQAHAQGACQHRGDLDAQYCDNNKDMRFLMQGSC